MRPGGRREASRELGERRILAVCLDSWSSAPICLDARMRIAQVASPYESVPPSAYASTRLFGWPSTQACRCALPQGGGMRYAAGLGGVAARLADQYIRVLQNHDVDTFMARLNSSAVRQGS